MGDRGRRFAGLVGIAGMCENA